MTFESKRPANLDELIDKIAAGEMTRQEAAAAAGLNFETFKGWLRRTEGALERLKHTRGNRGENHRKALVNTDPGKADAYRDAVAEILASKASARSIWQAKYKARGVSYVYLCELVDRQRQQRANEEAVRKLEAALRPDNGDGDGDVTVTV
jgi:transposase